MSTTRRITKTFGSSISAHHLNNKNDQRLKICNEAPIDCASDPNGEMTQVVAKDETGGMTTLTFLEVQTPYFHSKGLAGGVIEECHGVSLADEFDLRKMGSLLLRTQWFNLNVDNVSRADDSPSVNCAIDYAAKRAHRANIEAGVFLGAVLSLLLVLGYFAYKRYKRKCAPFGSRLFSPSDRGQEYGAINSINDSESQQQSVPNIEQEAQDAEGAPSEEQVDNQRSCCRVM